jgi:hypothetical protein
MSAEIGGSIRAGRRVCLTAGAGLGWVLGGGAGSAFARTTDAGTTGGARAGATQVLDVRYLGADTNKTGYVEPGQVLDFEFVSADTPKPGPSQESGYPNAMSLAWLTSDTGTGPTHQLTPGEVFDLKLIATPKTHRPLHLRRSQILDLELTRSPGSPTFHWNVDPVIVWSDPNLADLYRP